MVDKNLDFVKTHFWYVHYFFRMANLDNNVGKINEENFNFLEGLFKAQF